MELKCRFVLTENKNFGVEVDVIFFFSERADLMDEFDDVRRLSATFIDDEIAVNGGDPRFSSSGIFHAHLVNEFSRRHLRWVFKDTPCARGNGLSPLAFLFGVFHELLNERSFGSRGFKFC